MTITIITLFPQALQPILSSSILARAQKKGLIEFNLIDLRQFGKGRHKTVDDRPFGGGAGMILRPDVLAKALEKAYTYSPKAAPETGELVILMSASGKPFKQSIAKLFSKIKHLIIICGRYEGVDQRFIDKYVDEEISIGDYVLTGGEIPALVITDSVTRLIPGVLSKEEATEIESFSHGLLEYPQYTRPSVFEDIKVPDVLLSGNHQEIEKWRKLKSIAKTEKVRPDLLEKHIQ